MTDPNTMLTGIPKARFVDEASIMRLLSLLPINSESAFRIQFTSPVQDTGTSSITRDFAIVACTNLDFKVLLVSLEGVVDTVEETVRLRYGIDCTEIERPFFADTKDVFPLKMVENQKIKLSVAMLQKNERCEAFLSNWVNFIEKNKKEFDLILVDSMPLNRSYVAVTLSSKVDANIIVVAAEETSIAETKNLMNRLEEKDGHILGIVLNKRHFYIPDFIYKKI